jgi:hypothetical protein
LEGKRLTIVGEFFCRGFDTYGVHKLIGGIAHGRPTSRTFVTPRNLPEALKKVKGCELLTFVRVGPEATSLGPVVGAA